MGEMTNEAVPGETNDDFWERQMAASKKATRERKDEYAPDPEMGKDHDQRRYDLSQPVDATIAGAIDRGMDHLNEFTRARDIGNHGLTAAERGDEERMKGKGRYPKPTPFPPVKLPSNQVPRLPDPYLPTPLAPRVTRPEAWVVEVPHSGAYGVVDAMFKIARWCGGGVMVDHGRRALGIRVHLFGGRIETAFPGNFIVRQGQGSKVWYEVYETRVDLLADWQIMDSAIIPQGAFDASGWSEVEGDR